MKSFHIRFFLLFLFFCINLYASKIAFITHNTKEYSYIDTNGELRGLQNSGKRAFCIELVREVMHDINYKKDILDLPFKRAYKFVTTKNDFALFNISRTKKRENLLKWVGPILEDSSYFYKLKDNPFDIENLQDAKSVDSICVLRGGIHFKTLKAKGFTNLIENNSYVGCFEMLKTKKVTLTVSAEDSLLGKLKKANLTPNKIEGLKPLVAKAGGYIAFSKNISDDTINKWQNALDKIKEDGRYNQIHKEYFIKTP